MKLSFIFHSCARSFTVGAMFLTFVSFSQGTDTLQFYFETNEHASFVMSSEHGEQLKNLNKEARILAILGHCDIRGSEEYNINLSRQRMEFVRRYLKNEGFDVSKSSNEALGESMAEKSGLSLAKCRRVDVLFIEPATKITVKEIPTTDLEVTSNIEERQTTDSPSPDPFANTGISESAVQDFINDQESNEIEFDLSILFHNVSTRPLDESMPELFRLLEIMQNNPTLHATFHGHVCCNPHPELSEGRARTIALFLREYGIEADRLDFVGHSNTQPKVWPEVTDEDRKQNRRVVVVFTKSDE